MQTLTVELKDRSYPISIGPGLLQQGPLLRAAVPASQVLLVSNTTVAPLYAQAVASALDGHRILEAILPDGEQHKSLATAGRLFDVMIANRLGRDALVLALGGGVVGDLAGFVAACYQRGVDFVQLPTTLLAQVDSSVGGKTAVNHLGGKNLIGAFHQPRAVLADTSVLATLPERELQCGLAEIIKYALICDEAFLVWLEHNIDALRQRDPSALERAIFRSCQIKAQIVGRDEREHGERALLNLGHTFGHAIEAATGYSEWLHGEAVGVGLIMAASLSHRLGRLTAQDVQRITELVRRAGLRITPPQIGAARAAEFISIDKKARGGRVRLVLLAKPGEAFLSDDYPETDLHATLRAQLGA